MQRTRLIAGLAALALGGAITTSTTVGAPAAPLDAVRCVAPLDAAGIDAMLADAGSPLTGEGRTFVSASAAVGIDPRALVAIAAHETVLMTYAPAAEIHNPFGIGPHRRFDDDAAAISFAARLLADHYVGEGRGTLAEISGKWAPIGAANDPTNLNASWTGAVRATYARLGGDPDLPVTLDRQAGGDCSAAAAPGAATTPAPDAEPAPGRAIAWDGAVPAIAGPRMDQGADPRTGEPATVEGFVFPLVPSHPAEVAVADDFAEPGVPGCYGRAVRCATSVASGRLLPVVAMADGVLTAAQPSEAAEGIAFWIVTPDGDRLGYSGLSAYRDGIVAGTRVAAGRELGVGTAVMRFAWERDGRRINAAPLLDTTLRGG